MDLLILIKHFVAKVVINFVLISINLLLIIKLFAIKLVINLCKILMNLLIFIKYFVEEVVINFVLISINILLIIKPFVTKAVMNLFKILFNLLFFIKNFVAKVVMNFFKILLDLLIHSKVFVAKLVLTFVEITVNLCSKVVINLLIMSTKMWKFWSLNKFIRLMAFVTLFYQIISVTISYLEFETVIDMKAISHLKHEPTITICLKNDFEFPEIPQTILNKNFFIDPIGCYLNESGKTLIVKCDKLTEIVESVTTFSQRCHSYFSQLFDNKSIPIIGGLAFNIDNNMKGFALIHQKKTPPHFARHKIEISKSTLTLIDYKRIVTKILPFPYSTDCYDYENEENAVLNYKSREDCIVKHLEKKEFNECGCNKRWFYGYSRRQNLSNICPKTIECKFNTKSEMKSFEKNCKNNCLNEYYMNIFDNQNEVKAFSLLNIKFLMLGLTPKYEILFSYLPKMNFIEYLCSVGGLISMWFGFSVYDLVLIFAKESKKKILLLLVSIKCRLFTTAIVKFKEIILSKVNQIFSSITIIVFSALMLIQIIAIISSYFDFEIVTRFDVQQIKIIPNVMFEFYPLPNNLSKLYETYPQMKEEIHELNKIELLEKQFFTSRYVKIYHKYLGQLLIDNRLNDFHRIAQLNNYIKSCQMKIFDEMELKNCSLKELGIHRIAFELRISQLFDFSKLIDENKVEKITFRFNSSETLMIATLYSTLDKLIHSTPIIITFKAKTTAFFSIFSIKKLRSDEIECISEENQNYFTEDYFDFCQYDCIVDKVNQFCGCVPLNHFKYFLNKHFFDNNYKFCKNCSLRLDKSTVFSIENQCHKICKPKCDSLNFDTKIKVSKHVSNKTILEIIPIKTPRIAYIETLKTDFDRLIYNCGGILGLWFGITPIKAVDLIQYIPKICRIFINVCATIFQSLTAFWMRIKQK
jgi:hypothetical protein